MIPSNWFISSTIKYLVWRTDVIDVERICYTYNSMDTVNVNR